MKGLVPQGWMGYPFEHQLLNLPKSDLLKTKWTKANIHYKELMILDYIFSRSLMHAGVENFDLIISLTLDLHTRLENIGFFIGEA